MDKKDIALKFSRYANFYDRFSDIQREASFRLINEIEGKPKDILEIGCGTGFYTELLKKKFPTSRIVSLDISEEMVKIAKKRVKAVLFFVADGEEIGIKRRFDLITSNSCFQWFFNLKATLLQYKELLKKEGEIIFSIFGRETFWELRGLMGESYPDQKRAFYSKDELSCELEGFNLVLKEERGTTEYPSLFLLLKKIKYSAEGMRTRRLWTRHSIEKMEEAYRLRFGKIVATHQIFFCKIK